MIIVLLGVNLNWENFSTEIYKRKSTKVHNSQTWCIHGREGWENC